MITIEGPKDPIYKVTLVFDSLTYKQLLDLKDAVGNMSAEYSWEEYESLCDFITRGNQGR